MKLQGVRVSDRGVMLRDDGLEDDMEGLLILEDRGSGMGAAVGRGLLLDGGLKDDVGGAAAAKLRTRTGEAGVVLQGGRGLLLEGGLKEDRGNVAAS